MSRRSKRLREPEPEVAPVEERSPLERIDNVVLFALLRFLRVPDVAVLERTSRWMRHRLTSLPAVKHAKRVYAEEKHRWVYRCRASLRGGRRG